VQFQLESVLWLLACPRRSIFKLINSAGAVFRFSINEKRELLTLGSCRNYV
jgi:hypothetical protein